jgi:hypothetical protein
MITNQPPGPPMTLGNMRLSDDELMAEMLAGFSKAFPELWIVRRPALIEKAKGG